MLSNDATVADALKSRRSVRGFKPDPVPDEVITEILQLAQLSPSNCNVQPWRVLIASGEKCQVLRQQMHDAIMTGKTMNPDFPSYPKFEGKYRDRQIDCAKALYGAMGVERHDSAGRLRASARNYEFFDAPHVLFVGMERDFSTAIAVDVGMYAQSLMLLMSAQGIASCAQASVSYYPDIIRTFFDEPDNTGILFGISFGYEDEAVAANDARTQRIPISETVKWVR